MRILLAVHHLPPRYTGGAENRAIRTAAALQERGYQVKVVCVENIQNGPDDGVACEKDVLNGVAIRRLSFDLSKVPGEDRREYDNRWIRDYFDQAMRADPPDLFHLISGYLITAGPLQVAQILHIPTVVSLTDFWFLCPRINLLRSNGELSTVPTQAYRCVRCIQEEKRRYRWPGRLVPGLSNSFWKLHTSKIKAMEQRSAFLMQSLNSASRLISPSEFLRSMYIRAGLDPLKIEFSRQGYDYSLHQAPLRKEHSSQHLTLAYIGQISQHKGIHLILEAFALLRSKRISLKIYGKLDSEQRYSNSLLKQAASDSRIEFCGTFQPADLHELFRSIDVLVVPSLWYENSPNVILEAFAHRTPVLVTDLGGMKELVDDGLNGLLFKVGDPRDLALKIASVVELPEQLQKLREGIELPRSLDEEMDVLEGIYRGVLQSA
jgi:glycosyltransferase involved in cell wall biosynthesis